MSKLEDIDPLFSKEGSSKEEPQFRLEDIDPIFKVETKKPPAAAEASEKDFMSWLANKVEPQTLESAGAALAGAYLNPKIQSAADNFSKISGSAPAGAAPAGAAPTGATPTGGEKWAKNWAGQNRPGTSVPEASAAYQRSKGQGKITGRQAQMWGPTGPGEPSSLIDRQLARSAQAEAAAAAEAAQKAAAQKAAAAPLKQVANVAGNVMASAPRATGALAGLGAMEGMQNASNRFRQGDVAGAAIAGAGGIGSLASMIPHPVTRAIGAGVGMSSPAALMVLDKMRQQSAPNQPPTPQELETAGRPYFGTARP
jgi:hypothetical protein